MHILLLNFSPVQADYSLRYKTGVSAPRPRRHKFSEYQKAFEWKGGAKASPMLAAEQVINRFVCWGPWKAILKRQRQMIEEGGDKAKHSKTISKLSLIYSTCILSKISEK